MLTEIESIRYSDNDKTVVLVHNERNNTLTVEINDEFDNVVQILDVINSIREEIIKKDMEKIYEESGVKPPIVQNIKEKVDQYLLKQLAKETEKLNTNVEKNEEKNNTYVVNVSEPILLKHWSSQNDLNQAIDKIYEDVNVPTEVIIGESSINKQLEVDSEYEEFLKWQEFKRFKNSKNAFSKSFDIPEEKIVEIDGKLIKTESNQYSIVNGKKIPYNRHYVPVEEPLEQERIIEIDGKLTKIEPNSYGMVNGVKVPYNSHSYTDTSPNLNRKNMPYYASEVLKEAMENGLNSRKTLQKPTLVED